MSAFDDLENRVKATKTGTISKAKPMSAFDALEARQKVISPESVQQVQSEQEQPGFLKSLISAPATMIARPFQAIAELAGASAEDVDKFSKEKLGGFVASVPQSGADVKKDVGRAVQTAAFGLGPVAGGGAFGLGSSLEQGNDLFSKQTALNTGIGLIGGKALDVLGKPILDVAGKAIGKVTPQVVKDVAAKGAGAVGDFMGSHEILPKRASQFINKSAEGLENLANKPFQVAGDTIKKPFLKTPEKIIAAREKELAAIDRNYASMRKASGFSKDAGEASRRRIASTDILSDAVDENGLIRTTHPGGAVEQYQAQTIDGAEGVVRKNLERLGEEVDLKTVEKQLLKSINESGLEGADLNAALNKVKKEIVGYKLKAKNGKIPLTLVHDAKISTTKGINFQTPPEVATYRKSIARGLKETVENNSKFNTKEVNGELKKYYDDIDFLKRLDGKRVKGGKLGKYFAQISGNIIGGAAGGAIGGIPGSAVGTVVGGELAGRIKGSMLERTLAGKTGYVAPKNPVIEEAIRLGKTPYENNLGSLKKQYKPTPIKSNTAIPKSISKPELIRKLDVFKELITGGEKGMSRDELLLLKKSIQNDIKNGKELNFSKGKLKIVNDVLKKPKKLWQHQN